MKFTNYHTGEIIPPSYMIVFKYLMQTESIFIAVLLIPLAMSVALWGFILYHLK